MNAIAFPARITALHFEAIQNGKTQGEDAVLTLRTPVIGSQTRELLGGLSSHLDFEITIKRKGDYETNAMIGVVSGIDTIGRFKFLLPPQNESGLALGSFVVTERGIVAMVISAFAETGDLFRRLVETGTLTEARLLAERPAIEYTCVEVGGLGVDIEKGEFVYYHLPVFPPNIGEAVHPGPGGAFFDLSASSSAQLVNRLATIVVMRDVDPAVAANMIRNVARHAKVSAQDVKEAVVDPIYAIDQLRAMQVDEAFDTMFPGELT